MQGSAPTFPHLGHLQERHRAHDAQLGERRASRVDQHVEPRAVGLDQVRNGRSNEARRERVEVDEEEREEERDALVEVLDSRVRQHLLVGKTRIICVKTKCCMCRQIKTGRRLSADMPADSVGTSRTAP